MFATNGNMGSEKSPPELAVGEVAGTIYGPSAKGWIDQELFDLWFTLHFLRYAPSVRPLLLLMDGHSSHYCPATIKRAAEEKVIVFSLPPNTTHLTQPLDKGIFGPLKVSWRQVCHQYLVKHPGARVTKLNFSSLFSEAWVEVQLNCLVKRHLTSLRKQALHTSHSTPQLNAEFQPLLLPALVKMNTMILKAFMKMAVSQMIPGTKLGLGCTTLKLFCCQALPCRHPTSLH